MALRYSWEWEQNVATNRSSVNQINYINKLIGGLKVDGDWNEIDELPLFAVETQAQAVYKLKYTTNATITEVNSPTFTAKQGYTGNGTSMYINFNYNPSTQGVNYTLNDSCLGIYCLTNVAENTAFVGCTTATEGVNIGGRNASDQASGRVNNVTTFTVASTDSRGWWTVRRTTSTVSAIFKNGASQTTSAAASVAVPNLNVFILAINSAGTPVQYNTRQFAGGLVSSGGVNQVNINTRIEAYMDDIGAGIQ